MSLLIDNAKAREDLVESIMAGDSLEHLRAKLAPAMLDGTHRRHFNQGNSLFPPILERSLVNLHVEIGTPLEPYPDWRRPMASPRGSALLSELAAFMADPEAKTHQFRRAQHDRSTIENHIRSNHLDLDCRTERKGSPHTLVCTKNDHSYHRAVKQRADDEKLLAQLENLAGSYL